MIKDGHVKELRRLLSLGRSLAASARMTEMTEKRARNYRDDQRLPFQRRRPRDYRTRLDPFVDVWANVQRKLEDEPALKAKTLFEWLQETDPGRFPDSMRRTFERRVSTWRSLHGPNKTVYFSQIYHPGRLAASDFTVCNDLGVTIARVRFDHTLFHCVLTYSNVESVSLCFSESFEALSQGIQKALWEFGGVPQRHRSDSLVRKPGAFANYQYREEMFPTSQFRMAYDMLRDAHSEDVADKMYVRILELAARESEEAVIDSRRHLIAAGEAITVDRIRSLVASAGCLPAVTDIQIDAPVLSDFDSLLTMPDLLTTFDKECPNHDQNHETCVRTISSEDPPHEVAGQCS